MIKLKTREFKKHLKTLEKVLEAIEQDLTLLVVNAVVTIDLVNMDLYDEDDQKIGYIEVKNFIQYERDGMPRINKHGEPVGFTPIEVYLNDILKLMENKVPFLALRETSAYMEFKTWSLVLLIEDADKYNLTYKQSEDNPFIAYCDVRPKFIKEVIRDLDRVHFQAEGSIYEHADFKLYSKVKGQEYFHSITGVNKYNHKYTHYKLIYTFKGKRGRVLIPQKDFKENSKLFPALRGKELIKQTIANYIVGTFG